MNTQSTNTQEMNLNALNASIEPKETTQPHEEQPTLVETIEGDFLPMEDCYYCDYYGEYTSKPTEIVHTRRILNGNFSQSAIEALKESAHELFYYEGEYYERSTLWRFDLAIAVDTGEIDSTDNLYCHENGEYYTYEEEIETEYRRSYHSDSNTYFHRFTDNAPRFFIGYEIEKEDYSALTSIEIDEFETNCPKWRKEEDGSLSEEDGFELISPCFELNPEHISDYIKSSPTLLQHVNAHKSDRCGGHINISEDGKTGRELFQSIQGYTPLLHALYYKRIDKNYSKGKSNEELLHGDKYQSIRIHSNRVELRIVSAVPNLKTLIWRTRLVQYMLNNQTSDPREAFVNFHDNELKELISEVYYTPEKFAALNERLIAYTRTFEAIDLTDEVTTQRAKEKGVDTTPNLSKEAIRYGKAVYFEQEA
jgi:hypothetical protein